MKDVHERETVLVVGVGLIGGSLGLAMKQAALPHRVRGLDRPEVLQQALARGAIDEGVPDLETACRGARLVVLAAPVGAVLSLLPALARHLEPGALVTDTGSTKRRIAAEAARVWGGDASLRFLGGHPMAGKEKGSIEQAEANLFQGTRWILTPPPGVEAEAVRQLGPAQALLLDIIQAVGARPLWMDAETHDQALARLSHLPQLVSTALAATLHDAFLTGGEEPARLLEAGGSGVRDMTRLAASPYRVWRDILWSNTDAIEDALAQFQNTLDHLRLHLRDREMETCFEDAAELRRELRQRQGGGRGAWSVERGANDAAEDG